MRRLLVFALLCCAIPSLAGDAVTVDLHAHGAVIRAELLQHTPLGASLDAVVQFIARQLENGHADSVHVEPDPTRPGRKRIRIFLGQYYDHPEVVFFAAPLVSRREATAEWKFDRHDRLREIVVEKKSALY